MQVDKTYKHSELTSKIIGCAMEVHRYLGNGFQEVIDQRAIENEFRLPEIRTQREFVTPLFYKNEDIGSLRVNFFVEEKVMAEIKAIIELEDVHLAQAINYLEAYNLEIGLLLNLGNSSLQFKRVMNKKLNKS